MSRHVERLEVALVKVISGHRITLPESMRADYDLREGSQLALVRSPQGWLISRASVTATGMDGKPLDLSGVQVVG